MKGKLPNAVNILVLTTITSVMWIGFAVYQTFNKPEKTVVPSEILMPLTPTLDVKEIENLKQKIYFTP